MRRSATPFGTPVVVADGFPVGSFGAADRLGFATALALGVGLAPPLATAVAGGLLLPANDGDSGAVPHPARAHISTATVNRRRGITRRVCYSGRTSTTAASGNAP